jgi:5-methylcytosine-specific restriction enzyme subunit McrC
MATMIPITNLYYLLAYAWDHKLSEADLVAVDADSCPDLNNLFARILANATHHLVRRGLDRSYVPFEEETPRIRGRIDFSASEKNLTRTRGKLICVYDELSPDVLHNRIVKATLRLLRGDQRVHADSRKRLAQSLEAFHEVGDLRVTPHHFHRVQLHRSNRAYRFILHLCELIHASLIPNKSRDGTRRFRDFTRDEKVMARVFENFVRNFATRHIPESKVWAMHIGWRSSEIGEGTSGMLPRMITDVTVAWPDRKLILDCKYYQEALLSRYDALRFHSGNLYQLHAYLTNKAVETGWENVEGMLLYPSNGYRFDHAFTLHSRHRVRVCTVDLQQPWLMIETDLLGLLGSNDSSRAVGINHSPPSPAIPSLPAAPTPVVQAP